MPQVKTKLKVASAVLVVLTAVVAVSLLVTLLSSSSTVGYAQTSSPQYSVNIASKQGIGTYLTNATGFTLYTSG